MVGSDIKDGMDRPNEACRFGFLGPLQVGESIFSFWTCARTTLTRSLEWALLLNRLALEGSRTGLMGQLVPRTILPRSVSSFLSNDGMLVGLSCASSGTVEREWSLTCKFLLEGSRNGCTGGDRVEEWIASCSSRLSMV